MCLYAALIAILAGGAWWAKSSYDKTVIQQHETQVQGQIQRAVTHDNQRTNKRDQARARSRLLDSVYLGILDERASVDAERNAAQYNACALSPDGLRIVNDAIRAANTTEPVPSDLSDRGRAQDGESRGDAESADPERQSTEGVPQEPRMPSPVGDGTDRG